MDAGINPVDDDDAESQFRVPDGTFRAHYFMLRLHNVSRLNPTSGERSRVRVSQVIGTGCRLERCEVSFSSFI